MSVSSNLPKLYDKKENIRSNPEIPRINKVIDEDMNIIRELLLKSLYLDNDEIINIDNQTADPKIPRYEELKYDLITDGPAVKTGRKIDGKEEYVKRFSFKNLAQPKQTYSKPLGFILSNVIITGLEYAGLANSQNWFYATDDGSAATWGVHFHLRNPNNAIELTTLNSNMQEAYVNVYYVDKNEAGDI